MLTAIKNVFGFLQVQENLSFHPSSRRESAKIESDNQVTSEDKPDKDSEASEVQPEEKDLERSGNQQEENDQKSSGNQQENKDQESSDDQPDEKAQDGKLRSVQFASDAMTRVRGASARAQNFKIKGP